MKTEKNSLFCSFSSNSMARFTSERKNKPWMSLVTTIHVKNQLKTRLTTGQSQRLSHCRRHFHGDQSGLTGPKSAKYQEKVLENWLK
jgi:hypothetical protein